MVVAVQDERSQLQNKLRAMSILRARLYEIEQEKRRSAEQADRRSQVGTGERAQKIRTYNYPQNRVTDHRINLSIFNLPAVMQGGIDDFIDELSTRDELTGCPPAGWMTMTNKGGLKTIGKVLDDLIFRLKKKSDTPALDAQGLLARVMDRPRPGWWHILKCP